MCFQGLLQAVYSMRLNNVTTALQQHQTQFTDRYVVITQG